MIDLITKPNQSPYGHTEPTNPALLGPPFIAQSRDLHDLPELHELQELTVTEIVTTANQDLDAAVRNNYDPDAVMAVLSNTKNQETRDKVVPIRSENDPISYFTIPDQKTLDHPTLQGFFVRTDPDHWRIPPQIAKQQRAVISQVSFMDNFAEEGSMEHALQREVTRVMDISRLTDRPLEVDEAERIVKTRTANLLTISHRVNQQFPSEIEERPLLFNDLAERLKAEGMLPTTTGPVSHRIKSNISSNSNSGRHSKAKIEESPETPISRFARIRSALGSVAARATVGTAQILSAGAGHAASIFNGAAENQTGAHVEKRRSSLARKKITAAFLAGSMFVMSADAATFSGHEDTRSTPAVTSSSDSANRLDDLRVPPHRERPKTDEQAASLTHVNLSVNGAKSTISENLLDKINVIGLKLPQEHTQAVINWLGTRLTEYNGLMGRDRKLPIGAEIIIPSREVLASWIADAERSIAGAAR